MQFNYYFLKALSSELQPHLKGKKILVIFSQNKNELVLCFGENDTEFTIKANLDNDTSLLSFPQQFSRARKNSVDLFDAIFGLKVVGVKQFINERAFTIQFEKGYDLLFKLHGRQSNIILFHEDKATALFKNQSVKDLMIDLKSLDRRIDQSDTKIIALNFDLSQAYPTFDRNIKNHLKSLGFYDPSADDAKKLSLLRHTLDQLNDKKYYITEGESGVPQLLLFKPEICIETFDTSIAACNFLAQRLFSYYNLYRTKAKLWKEVKRDIRKSQSYIQQATSKLKEIQTRRGYDELANILMANLHVATQPKDKAITLLDFYSNETITIKLKPHQSLQQNAEMLYRKAKNQSKEIATLARNIKSKQEILDSLKAKEQKISEAKDLKSIKALDKSKRENSPTPVAQLFIEHTIDGYQVFVGKNAANNDILTQKFAKKDDLWLHARDVSGSHVIIRNPHGGSISLHTIEKVAQIAAWHSKRKSDSLCPVIYTPKKYVRKPKGSHPGQVLLSKEQVILVKPIREVSSHRE